MFDAGGGEAGGKAGGGAGADRRRHGATLARMRQLRAIRFHDHRSAQRDFVRMGCGRRAPNGARQCTEQQDDAAKARDDCARNRTTPPHQPADMITPPHAPAITEHEIQLQITAA
jgi:hypothetical protein